MTSPALTTLTVPVGSLGTTTVTVDPWAANPLVDGFRAKNPQLFEAALADGPAPTLFESGDLPPFTASGVDPQVLTSLPFGCRHFAASDSDRGRVLDLIERSSRDPNASLDTPGLADYVSRVVGWLTGRTNQTPTSDRTSGQRDADDATYDTMFSELDAYQQAKNAPAAAAAQTIADMHNRVGVVGRAGR